ncbi:unnamed protein product, partial [Effrenium voratum]
MLFISGIMLWFRHCCASLPLCILVAQELSSPALNVFTLLRAYKGINSVITQGVFVIFAVLFYIFRVFLNTFGVVHAICEVVHSFWDWRKSALRMPRFEGALLILVLV